MLYQTCDRYSGRKRGNCEERVEIGVKSEYSCIVLLALLVWPGDLILRVTKGAPLGLVCACREDVRSLAIPTILDCFIILNYPALGPQ